MLAAERYDGAEPVNLGTGVRDLDPRAGRDVAEVTGFEGEIIWDTSMPNGQPRRSARRLAGRGAVRLPGADAAARRARAHGRLVPLARARACRWLSGCGRCCERPRQLAAAARGRRSSGADGARRRRCGRDSVGARRRRAAERRAARPAGARVRVPDSRERVGASRRRVDVAGLGGAALARGVVLASTSTTTRCATRAPARGRPDRRDAGYAEGVRDPARCAAAPAERSRVATLTTGPRALVWSRGAVVGCSRDTVSDGISRCDAFSGEHGGLREYSGASACCSGCRSPARSGRAPLGDARVRSARWFGGFVAGRGDVSSTESGSRTASSSGPAAGAAGLRPPRRRDPAARADPRGPPRPARPARPGLVGGRVSPQPLLEQGDPLREDRVLVGEPRDHRRVVQQHGRMKSVATAKSTAGG